MLSVVSRNQNGLEKTIRTERKTLNNQLDLTLMYNYQTNKVLNLGTSNFIYDVDNVLMVGLPKHEFYTWRVNGALFDENGVYTGPDADKERTRFGNPIPSYTGSFSFNFRFLKDFTLYFMMDWATNMKVLSETVRQATNYGNNPEFNYLATQLGIAGGGPDYVAYFVKPVEGVEELIPGTPEYKDAAEKFSHLDWRYIGNFIYDGDYLKIREISIRYSLNSLLKKTSAFRFIRNLSIGFSARNLFSFSKYLYGDPEVN